MPTPVTSAFGTRATEYAHDTPTPQTTRNQLIYSSGIKSPSNNFAQRNVEQAKESNKTELDCSSQELTDAHMPDLTKYPLLTEVNFAYNHLTCFPKCSQDNQIKTAFLRGNKLREGLAQLTQLEVLDLDRNGLSDLPALTCGPHLKSLSVSNNSLAKAPDFSPYPNLEQIALQRCDLEQLVDVSKASKLKYLDLSRNRQWQWPNLSNNPDLISLDCGKNAYNLNVKNGNEGQLIGIPLDLSGTPKLEELYLYSNGLEQDQVPDLSPLIQLRILSFSGNHLTEQPNILNSTKLEQIYLNDNKLTRGLDFCPLTELQILEIKNNRLIEQPDISGLAKLKRIDLSGNKIDWATEFSTNTDLEEIFLNHNKLKIPPDVSNKPKLLYLNLRDNLLEKLHESTFDLPSTCTVYAAGNRFSSRYIEHVRETINIIRSNDSTRGPTILFK